jgi:hypothetical protein
MANSSRLSFDLPAVPNSLRAFIEAAVKDQRLMLAFVESPVTALRASGVPIKTDCLVKADCDRLVRVLGKLRNLVASGKIAKDFRFEEVFTIGANVEYEQTKSSTDSYIEKNFDHSTEGHDSEQKSSTEEGIKTNFQPFGLPQQIGDEIIAPLLSPGALAAIVTQMQAKLSATYGG